MLLTDPIDFLMVGVLYKDSFVRFKFWSFSYISLSDDAETSDYFDRVIADHHCIYDAVLRTVFFCHFV